MSGEITKVAVQEYGETRNVSIVGTQRARAADNNCARQVIITTSSSQQMPDICAVEF